MNPVEIAKSLYDRYYVRPASGDESHVSSHWKYYGSQFQVKVDPDGSPAELSGVGFGDMMGRDPIQTILSYLCHLSYLIRLPHRLDILKLCIPAMAVCRRMGAFFSFDCFKQVCSWALIHRHLSARMKSARLNILVIGDGYGFMSCLIKSILPNSTLVLVDLGKTLTFQAHYCPRVFPECRHALLSESGGEEPDFIYCPAEDFESIGLRFDIGINIVSMQEMNPKTIQRYFTFMRRRFHPDNLFYCCNRESKQLRGGELLEFLNYPWNAADRHLVDEYCPWYRYIFWRYRGSLGPAVFGRRIPWVNYFDGPIRHRLSVLDTALPGQSG